MVQANGLAILSRLTSGKGIAIAVWVLCDEEVVSRGVSIIPDTISTPACLDFLDVLQGEVSLVFILSGYFHNNVYFFKLSVIPLTEKLS